MKIKSSLQVIVPFSLLGLSLFAFADNADTVMARQLVVQKDEVILPETDITMSEREFTYDWTNDKTVHPNENKVKKIETVLKQVNVSEVNKNEKEAMGNLLYRLATFYNFVSKDPERAIAAITSANQYISDQRAKTWSAAQLAYAYEMRYEKSHNAADKDMAIKYSNEVASQYHGKPMREVAFAYWVQGLVAQNSYDFDQAEKQFQKSIAMYESLPNRNDQQFERMKTQLASLWTEKNYQDVESLALLQEQNQLGRARPNYDYNPEAARNLLALAHAHLKVNNPHAAMHEVNKSVSIYQNVYGTPAWIDESDVITTSAAQPVGNDHTGADFQDRVDVLSHG